MADTSDNSTPSTTLCREDQNVPVLDTVLVTGSLEHIGKDALKLYFNNKKKCGGEGIVIVLIQQDKAFITFSDTQGI